MDIRQLYYFVTAADEGNISLAAKKLHMSQPPLSTQLRRLEEELGCVLFERGARKIQLTEAGNMLYRRAVNLLEMADTIKREMNDYSSGINGVLRLGIVSSVENAVLDLWIDEFHKIYPGICFEISEANTYEILEMLRANLLDMAFVRTPFTSDDTDKIPLKREKMYALGHKRFFSGRNSLKIEELDQKPIIIYKRWEKVLYSIFSEVQIKPIAVCINEDARTTAAWADKGIGIGILPESAVGMARNRDTIGLEITDNRLISELYLISGRNKYRSAIAESFWKYVQECRLF